MIDGVVWKLRNPRVGRVLVQADATAADGAPAATARGDRGCRARTAPGVHVGLAGGTRRGARPPRRGRSVALRPGHRPRRARPAGRSGAAQPVRQRHLPAPGPGRERGRRSGGRRGRAAARRRRQPAEPGPRPGAGAPADRSQPVRRGLPAMPGDAGAMAGRRQRARERRRPRRSAGRRRGGGALVDRRRSRAIRRSAASTCISPSASTRAARPATPSPTTGATSSWRRERRRTTAPIRARSWPSSSSSATRSPATARSTPRAAQYDLAIRMAGQTGLADLGALAADRARARSTRPALACVSRPAPVPAARGCVRSGRRRQEILGGAAGAVVGGEEEDHLGELVGAGSAA